MSTGNLAMQIRVKGIDRDEFLDLTGVLDEYGQVMNTLKAALFVNSFIDLTGACAIALAVGHATMFHMSFVDLHRAVPSRLFTYADGSSRGLQINIHTYGSYSYPWLSAIGEPSYIGEKWGINPHGVTVTDLWPFLNTVLTRDNYYLEPMPWLDDMGLSKQDVGKP